MSAAFERVIDEIDSLSPKEKALVAHRLIESLDSAQDDDAEQVIMVLAIMHNCKRPGYWEDRG